MNMQIRMRKDTIKFNLLTPSLHLCDLLDVQGNPSLPLSPPPRSS